MMGRAILLTGRPRVGKTTVIMHLLKRLPGPAGGFYTQEISREGRRLGFKIFTLEGEEGILAHVDLKGGPRVGKYRVNVRDLERIGVAALRRAMESSCYLVIDEIGKMELCSEEFRRTVMQALDSDQIIVGTVMLAGDPWTEALKADPRVTVLEVTAENRQGLVARIEEMLRSVSSRD